VKVRDEYGARLFWLAGFGIHHHSPEHPEMLSIRIDKFLSNPAAIKMEPAPQKRRGCMDKGREWAQRLHLDLLTVSVETWI
jgi:hypothetical protein